MDVAMLGKRGIPGEFVYLKGTRYRCTVCEQVFYYAIQFAARCKYCLGDTHTDPQCIELVVGSSGSPFSLCLDCRVGDD